MPDTDVLIVGTGVSGLYCALHLPLSCRITMIAKSDLTDCDSYLAQGGICMLRNEEDYNSYFEDTMHAGHYENDPKSVEIMIRSSQDVIRDLIEYGVDFERNEDGSLKFTREGAHHHHRILFHEDITGKAITSVLLDTVKRLPNVTLLDHVTMNDIITGRDPEGRECCQGIVAKAPADSPLVQKLEAGGDHELENCSDGQKLFTITAKEVVWACGGIGGLFQHSTNFPQLTGDALGISLKHKIALRDPDYIQIHPTTLYTKKKERAFLISESVRGEGGILLNKAGERFVNELLARDVVSKAIHEQMEADGTNHVWLSMEKIPEDVIRNHFKHIYERCLEEGYDCTKGPSPVVPAQHYFMGGVQVDHSSRTNMSQLYAVGETACNGVHGANRLASNSLLESMVFAERAAADISDTIRNAYHEEGIEKKVDLSAYTDAELVEKNYHDSIISEIERMKKKHEQNHPAA